VVKLPSLKPPSNVRLLPAMMITAGVVLGLKAVALAEAAGEATSSTPPAPAPATASGVAPANGNASQPAAAQSCPAPSFADQAGLSAQEVEVLQSLGARRTSLDQRATEMSTDAELLAASEKRVNERLAELQRVQGVVEGLLGKLNDEQEARVAGMVTVYSKMKPKDAAKVFEGLDDETLLQIASRMKQTNLSEIMGAMQPASAGRLTKNILESRKISDDAVKAAGPVSAAKAG
jgi:flagellar motility protein MotE (MotC chaperone)